MISKKSKALKDSTVQVFQIPLTSELWTKERELVELKEAKFRPNIQSDQPVYDSSGREISKRLQDLRESYYESNRGL